MRLYSLGGYKYLWDVDGASTPPSGTYYVTVAGTQTTGNAYVAGTQSLTFTIDSSVPTASLSSSDLDNLITPSSVVTITAAFSKSLLTTPTLSISGTSISNQIMTGSPAIDSRAFIALDPSAAGTYSSSIINDLGTNSNNFEFVGPVFVEDPSENYISFDGVNDYLKSVNDPNVTNGISGTNFSFLFRIKFNGLPPNGENDRFFSFNRSNSTYSNQFQLRLNSNRKLAYYMDGGGSGGNDSATSNSAIELGRWYDLAFVKSGTSFKIYIDGTLDRSYSVSNRSYSNPRFFYFGGNTRDSGAFTNMHLKKTQAYNVALSIDEINQNFLSCLLYTSPSPRDLSTSRMPSSA